MAAAPLARAALPAYQVRDQLVALMRRHETLVVVGGTGCGKTTQIPQVLLDGEVLGSLAVAVTQPRRVAAITVAQRVAAERGESLPTRRPSQANADDHASAASADADAPTTASDADAVGYAVRFDDCSIPGKTRIRYVTDGLLLREMQQDPLLRMYSVVIVDEAHERSLATDVALGMLKQIQNRRRELANAPDGGNGTGKMERKKRWLRNLPPLRIIVMSATLDTNRFRDFFKRDVRDLGPPIAFIQGRQFPVTMKYLAETVSDYVDAAVTTVLQIHEDAPHAKGDILVFLTGRDEIHDAMATLEERLRKRKPTANGTSNGHHAQGDEPLEILSLPLYAALPPHEQAKVFAPTAKGRRKVVWSTNVAETSVTVPGILHVVDSGVVKERRVLTRVAGGGVAATATACAESLAVVPVSRAAARQRAGRAGREAAGTCYRLYTEATFEQTLAADATPELLRSSLDGVVLTLKAYGVKDIRNFDFVDQPSMDGLLRALEGLYQLGALDDAMELTPEGRVLSRFPLVPALAKCVWCSFGESAMARIRARAAAQAGNGAKRQRLADDAGDVEGGAAGAAAVEEEEDDGDVCLGAVLNLVAMLDLGDACPPLAPSASARYAAGTGAGDRGAGARPEQTRQTDFAHPAGDHVALALMMESYVRGIEEGGAQDGDAAAPPTPKKMRKRRVAWCERYGVSPAVMQRAEDIRKQLATFCFKSFRVDALQKPGAYASHDNGSLLRRCVCRGFFPNASRKRVGGATQYESLASAALGGSSGAISVHPSSCLHPRVIADTVSAAEGRGDVSRKAARGGGGGGAPPAAELLPEFIVFTDAVFTTRLCARGVTACDPSWLADMGYNLA